MARMDFLEAQRKQIMDRLQELRPLHEEYLTLEKAHQALVSRGVHFETEPVLVASMATHDLWLAEFRDSENNVLALMCEKPKPGT